MNNKSFFSFFVALSFGLNCLAVDEFAISQKTLSSGDPEHYRYEWEINKHNTQIRLTELYKANNTTIKKVLIDKEFILPMLFERNCVKSTDPKDDKYNLIYIQIRYMTLKHKQKDFKVTTTHAKMLNFPPYWNIFSKKQVFEMFDVANGIFTEKNRNDVAWDPNIIKNGSLTNLANGFGTKNGLVLGFGKYQNFSDKSNKEKIEQLRKIAIYYTGQFNDQDTLLDRVANSCNAYKHKSINGQDVTCVIQSFLKRLYSLTDLHLNNHKNRRARNYLCTIIADYLESQAKKINDKESVQLAHYMADFARTLNLKRDGHLFVNY